MSQEQALRAAQSFEVTRLVNISVLAVLVYDYLITIQDEVQYIWQRPKSIFVVLWLNVRYAMILCNVLIVIAFWSTGWSPAFCLRWHIPKTAILYISVVSCRLGWIMRAYALWNRPRWFIWFITPAVIAESVIVLVVVSRIKYLPMPHYLPDICLVVPRTTGVNFLAWVIPFLFDTALSALAVTRAWIVSQRLKSPFSYQLLRDGFLYYLFITSLYVVALTLYYTRPQALMEVGQGMIGLIGLASSRFLLNIRKLKTEDCDRFANELGIEPGVATESSFGILTVVSMSRFLDEFVIQDAPPEPTIHLQSLRRSLSLTPKSPWARRSRDIA